MHSIMLFQDGTSGFSRFQEFINKPITINDPNDPIEITSVNGNLSFNNVSFSMHLIYLKSWKRSHLILNRVSILPW